MIGKRLVRQQYGQRASLNIIVDRVVSGVPSTSSNSDWYSLIIFYSLLQFYQYSYSTVSYVSTDSLAEILIVLFSANRYKSHRRMKIFIFLLATAVGPRLIYLVNKANWITNMKQVCCSCDFIMSAPYHNSRHLLLRRYGFIRSFNWTSDPPLSVFV
jgi:hypothetical protein